MPLLLVCFLLGSFAVGPRFAGAEGVVRDTTKRKSVSWSVLPIIFTSPDTDWAFGILPQVVFRLPRTQRQSRVFLAGYYTLNEQYAVSAIGSLWFNENRDYVEFGAETRYWPTDFYGLSAQDTDVEGIPYAENLWSASVLASRTVGPRFRLGISGRMMKMDIETEINDSPDNLGTVQGSEGGWLISLGPTVGIDSRDDVFYPTAGWLVNLSMPLSGFALGGDYDFLTVRADARTYHRLSSNHVLAAQAVLVFNSADVPFWGMEGVGSVVRGYTITQFLDRHLAAMQLEYRIVPVVWRLGLVAFAGLGTVAAQIDELPRARFRWAAGLGIRVVFLRDAKINIRWDFGFGPGSSGDYLDMAEAF